MIRQLLLGLFMVVGPLLRHPNWMVRRPAQAIGLVIAAIWLALPGSGGAESCPTERTDELARQLWSSARLQEFLHGPAFATPLVGCLCRALVLQLWVVAKRHGWTRSGDRTFALRLDQRIDQAVLRNLLIWQNHVLPAHSGGNADPQVDLTLVLGSKLGDEPRLFDLFSIALMLEHVRSVAVFWDEEAAARVASTILSNAELSRWRAAEPLNDLGNIPRGVTAQVDLLGTRGGVKLFPVGRKYANDFLKQALPGRLIIAVGLREREDGRVDPGELEYWLGLIDRLSARRRDVAFVVLNCLPPSQCHEWQAHVRYARHQGLTLQDAVCLAQIADGYFGVLDIFGLAAHSAGRPGVYVPLEDGDRPGADIPVGNMKSQQIMIGSRERARIEMAVEAYAAALLSA
jgi:hypothetical protein